MKYTIEVYEREDENSNYKLKDSKEIDACNNLIVKNKIRNEYYIYDEITHIDNSETFYCTDDLTKIRLIKK